MKKQRQQAGFTLIELMVGLVIALIVGASAVALYIGGKHTARLSRELTMTQDAGRLLLDMMARELRAAGDFGCPTPDNRVNTLVIPTVLNLDAPGLRGFDAANPIIDAGRLGGSTVSGANPISDVVSVSAIAGGYSTLVSQMAGSSARLTVVATDGFQAGDIAIVSNCLESAVFEVTNVNQSGATTSLFHAAGGTSAGGGNVTPSLTTVFNIGAEVGRLETTWWFVGRPNGLPQGLYRVSGSRGQVGLVSERVQAMEVTYQVDSDNDGVPNDLNVIAAAVTDWNQVTSMRIAMLLRSQNQVLDAPSTYFFNGASVTPTDRFLYMPVEVSVRLRNR